MCERGEGAEDLRDRIPVGAFGDSIGTGLLSAVRQFYDVALLWHREEPANESAGNGIGAKALQLHVLNFALWHHEDAIRRPGADDHEVARRKRRIDNLNVQRNASIEDIDATLLDRVDLNPSAPLHTETPGAIVDRISVLSLRILHTNRGKRSSTRVALLEQQYDDLVGGLAQLLMRMQAGEVRFKRYRQFKSAAEQSYCDLFEGRDI
jgi:hypothetical protein